MTMIGLFDVGMAYRLIVFDTIGGNVLSQRRFSAGGVQLKFEMRALLINSAGTSGFVMDINFERKGTKLFKYNPMLTIANRCIFTDNGNPGGIVFGSNENMIFAFFDSDDLTSA
jgi:hypothetical protein